MAAINTKASTRSKPQKPTDAALVYEFMGQLEHPLKAEINAVRAIIKNTNAAISERIKWAAPSYFTSVDLVTFNLRMATNVHLVFHNEAIVNVKSDLLLGSYKDRRMMYFENMAAVEANKAEFERIMSEYVTLVEKAT